MTPPMRVVVWNVERKRPTVPTGAAGVRRIERESPDIAVITEARLGHLDSLGGHEITTQPPAGSRFAPDERKALVWSRNPWRDVDDVGDPNMPHGRFIAGTTNTPLGDVRVIGVCIPWHMCDVTYGGKDRKPWEQHLRWLALFAELLRAERALPTIVAGDFNQRVPRRKGGRVDAAEALAQTLSDFEIVTQGTPTGCGRQGIDHIAIDRALTPVAVRGWPNDDGGVRMSDHDAAVADLALAG